MKATPLVLAAALSTTANANTLPRSDAEMSVGALVRCLGSDPCEVRHVCVYADDRSPATEEHASVAASGVWRSPLTSDARLACRVAADAGSIEVAAVLEHVGGDRELETIRSLMTRGGTHDWATSLNLPVGNDHCHPAAQGNPCPDAQHLVEGVHRGREVHSISCDHDSVGYAYFRGTQRHDIVEKIVRNGLPEGPANRVHISVGVYDASWYQNTGNLAYWRVECDADACGTYGAGPVDNNVSAKGYQLTYVAPWVDADTEIRVKATYRTGDGCASSTLRFTVLDDDR